MIAAIRTTATAPKTMTVFLSVACAGIGEVAGTPEATAGVSVSAVVVEAGLSNGGSPAGGVATGTAATSLVGVDVASTAVGVVDGSANGEAGVSLVILGCDGSVLSGVSAGAGVGVKSCGVLASAGAPAIEVDSSARSTSAFAPEAGGVAETVSLGVSGAGGGLADSVVTVDAPDNTSVFGVLVGVSFVVPGFAFSSIENSQLILVIYFDYT